MTKSLLEVESDMILGKGAFGRCVKCRVKDILFRLLDVVPSQVSAAKYTSGKQ